MGWATRTNTVRGVAVALLAAVLSMTATPAQDEPDLSKQLANPVASLISLPIQLNYDDEIGPSGDGSVLRMNIQPVIPFSLNENWNLISRTIVPIIDQDDIPVDGAGETGLGDILQSLFFSPKAPTSSGWIWGVGPALLLDTATDDALGAGQWGIGPTVLALKQTGPWTYGGLMNHIESFAGSSGKADISSTFVQPFLSYVTRKKTTLGANLESTYDWERDAWSVPLNLTVNQLLMFGKRPVQIGGGLRYWLDSPSTGPEGLGIRLQLTFLFPKK